MPQVFPGAQQLSPQTWFEQHGPELRIWQTPVEQQTLLQQAWQQTPLQQTCPPKQQTVAVELWQTAPLSQHTLLTQVCPLEQHVAVGPVPQAWLDAQHPVVRHISLLVQQA
jgi:hypothetical protein